MKLLILGFWVAVLPFKAQAASPDLAALADGLSEEIVTGLSRFSYLRVIARGSTAKYSSESGDVRAIGKELGARYVIEGTLRQAGSKLRLTIQLMDAVTGAHLWAENYERTFSPEAMFELQDDLVPRIVSTVADTQGVLPRGMSEVLRTRNPNDLSPYEAVLRSFAYFQRVNAEEHAASRAALENAVELQPGYADAWAMLSLIFKEEFTHELNLRPDPLGRAFAAAQRAVEGAPSNHLAYHALAMAQYFLGDRPAFRIAAARALELNPMDAFSVAFLGSFIAYDGDWELGCKLSAKARSLNPHHPGWYWFVPCFDAYRKGDYRLSLEFARKVNMPSLWRTCAVMAAAYGQLGEIESARTPLQTLLTLRPNFQAEARKELAIYFGPDLVQGLIDGLRKAGIVIPEAAATAGQKTSTQLTTSMSGAGVVPDSGATGAEEGFWVAVLPFKAQGASPDLAALGDGLSEEIVTGLSRFSYLRVIARGSTAKYSGESGDVRAIGKELGARYVMEGTLRQAGAKLRIALQLIDAVAGAHLWAETYDRNFSPEAIFELQDDLVPRVVSTVADSYGVLPHSMSESLRSKAEDQLTPHEAVIRSFGYLERLTPDEHAQVRRILENAVRQAPGLSDAWAMLSWIYWDERAHGFNIRPDPLGRALAAARRAIDAAPSNHLAHLALAITLFFQKDFLAFRPAALRAVKLNPMDGSALAWMGILTAYAGDWEGGCAHAESAMRLNPNHPGWYWFPLAYNAYRTGDYRGALGFALKINIPGYFFTHLITAAAYGQLGMKKPAQKAVDELLALRPDINNAAREDLGIWFQSDHVEHVLDGLRKAGLEIADEEAARATPAKQSGPNIAMAVPSIAVLPFANLSAEKDQEYFSDGLAEEIINLLAQISGLKVIARTSAFALRGKEQNVRAITQALGVTTILQGSVRRAGSRIRVTVQLINSADSAHIWSERYDREMTDVFAMQDEIAAAIAGKLQVKLSASPPRYVPQPAAYEEFLKARHHLQRWTPESAARGRECLERAIALDPGFALAHSDLGWCFYILAIENQIPPREAADAMRATARKALEIESWLPDVHGVLAMAAVLDYDWSEAGREFELVMASDQIQPFIRYLHSSFYLVSLGRMKEAEQGIERAIQEDPLNVLCRTALGSFCLASGRFAQGEAILNGVLQLDDNFWIAQSWLGFSCLKQNRLTEAIAYEEKARLLASWNPTVIGRLAAMHERVGEKIRAHALLKELGDGTAFGVPGGLLCYYAVLGNIDSAADWYEKAIEQRDPRAPWLFPLQFGELFTSSPRWPGLLRTMNLPTAAGLW